MKSFGCYGGDSELCKNIEQTKSLDTWVNSLWSKFFFFFFEN